MRTLIIGLLLAISLARPGSAQTVGGSYTVRGTNPNGTDYSGTVQITPSSSACRMAWQTGSTSSSGICMLANEAFAAHYVVLGGKPGLVVYELQPDGSLKGFWTIADTDGAGTENLYPKQ